MSFVLSSCCANFKQFTNQVSGLVVSFPAPRYANVAVGVGINPEEQTTEVTVHTYFYHSIGSASVLSQHIDQLCAFFGQLARQTGLTQTQGFYSCFQHYI